MDNFISFRGRAACQMAPRMNKITGCETPRCRRCKCRDGLPLTKVSHWRDLRRQADRCQDTSQKTYGMQALLCTRAMGREQFCYAEKRPRQSRLPRHFASKVQPYPLDPGVRRKRTVEIPLSEKGTGQTPDVRNPLSAVARRYLSGP